MSQKVRRTIEWIILVLFFGTIIVFSENPTIKYLGILIAAILYLILSVIYIFTNRPIDQSMFRREAITDMLVLFVIILVLLVMFKP